MSLGVLNNLSAMYAANNLSNTQNSLTKTLQQLSSGSRINSGADDAAGLALVNGLQANAQALAQSKTNAQEGVGLLTVADGALSQVTNLLNRAVTLATEVSNGTLNTSQQSAANMEYQSILSEISNIGTTTTYNQKQVFGSTTDIFTGDSSTVGASVNSLNIRSLSASNVGDSNGAMSYSTGASGNNVFIDLSVGTDATANLATAGDFLNGGATGSTTLTVTTQSGTGSTVGHDITVGGSSGFANTAQGMINAINNQNLGVTASFTTDKIAGKTGATGDTGIMLTGSVGAGTSPTTSSYSGTVAGGQANAGLDNLTGSVTLQVGNGAATTITMAQVAKAAGVAQGAVKMSDLASYLTSNASLGVTASVDASTGVLTVTSSDSSHSALKLTSNLTDTSIASGPAQLSYSATAAYSVGISTDTVANGGIVDSNIGSITATTLATTPVITAVDTVDAIAATITGADSMKLSGVLTIQNGDTGTTVITLGQSPTTGFAGTDNLTNLADTITALGTNHGFKASYSSGTLTITQDGTTNGGGTAKTTVTIAADATASQSAAIAPGLAGTSTKGGVATISYSDQAGTSLGGTDLSSQSDAQSALTALNSAISSVSAQDGYLGAMINTLNAVSSVLATQSQNVTAAQNVVQATDYATAASDMSKYQILSQTGIAALSQANSMQREVTKLLQ